MLLSIIVPVYNMAKEGKLEYCLQSLLKQTLSDYEIIAVDDCSTDESLAILRTYEANNPEKIKVIASPVNKKQGGAKNLGLKIATGQWIGFVDSDDWVTRDMYEKMITKAQETGADMVGCDYHITSVHDDSIGIVVANNKQEQTGILDDAKYRQLILDSGSLVVKIYKKDTIFKDDIWFPEDIFYEDNAIGAQLMLRATHFEYMEEPFYAYYQHEESTVHTITKDRCEHRMCAARMMIEQARKEGTLEHFREEFEYSFTQLFYVHTLFSYLAGVKKKEIQFVKKMGKEMKQTFPDFEQNKYYKERTGAEEQKLIGIHMKSAVVMVAYYTLLNQIRTWKKQILNKSK